MSATEKFAKTLALILSVSLFILPVIIGIQSHSVWIGFLVLGGMLFSLAGTAVYGQHENLQAYLFLTMLSLFSLVLAIWLSRLASGWWWTGVWLIVTVTHVGVFIDALGENNRHASVALRLAIFSFLAAFLIPGFVGPSLQRSTSFSISISINLWVWITLIAALIVLGIAWYQGYRESEEKNFALLASIGFILLLVSTWLSKLEGGWWWVLPWASAALIIWHAAQDLRQYSFGRSAGNFGVFLAILCLLIGIGGPYLAGRGWSLPELGTQQAQPAPTLSQADVAATQLAQAIQTATASAQPVASPMVSPTPLATATASAPTVTPTAPEQPVVQVNWDMPAAWKAVGGFLLAAVKSVWGIFHLLVFALLGYSWLRRGWGILLMPLAFLLAVGIAGGFSSSADEILTQFISSSPAGWMRNLLHFSVEQFGQAGWGIIMLGILVAIGLLPASYQIATARYRLRNVLPTFSIKGALGSQLADKFYEHVGRSGVNVFLTGINSIITSIVLLGLLVALWVGLRQVTQEENFLLTAWGIPDLAIPNWSLVWKLPYWVLATVVAIIAAIVRITLGLVTNGFEVNLSSIPTNINRQFILIVLVGTFIFALFVPAGVSLFMIGNMVGEFLSAPLISMGITQVKGEEERKRLEEERQRLKEEKKRLEQERQQLQEERKRLEQERQQLEEEKKRLEQRQQKEEGKSALKGERIWIAPTPLASMAVLDNLLYCLAKNGDLFCPTMASKEFALAIRQGQALFAFKEDQLLVIGNDKDVLWVDKQSGGVVKRATLSSPSDKAMLNPYKTMLAWVSAADRTVKVLALESGREFTLLSEIDLVPALAFSIDGRYIAIGTSKGDIQIVDFATRKTIATLSPPESIQQSQMVQAIYAPQGGGWLCVYTDRQIVLWDANNQIGNKTRPVRRILAVDFHVESGHLALGMSEGVLQVLDRHLNKIFEGKVQEKEITHVCFSQNGRHVFTIGEGTEVRRVDL